MKLGISEIQEAMARSHVDPKQQEQVINHLQEVIKELEAEKEQQNPTPKLKNNGKFVVNIADVTIGSKKYPLVNDTINLSIKIGFRHIDTFGYSLKKTIGTRASFENKDSDYKKEPVLIFSK